MTSKNRNASAGNWEGSLRCAQAFRKLALGFCIVSTLLLAENLQPHAATPVEVTTFDSNPGNLRMFKYIPDQPAVNDMVKGYPHHVFKNAAGTAMVETFSITGMGHGYPVDPGTGPEQCGTAAPFIINARICSSFFIAKFWGLVSVAAAAGSI